MTANEILREARDPFGGRRFYPAWQHPATARLRQQRERLLVFTTASPERDDILAYINQQLARFEHGEFFAKERYLERMTEAA